jgi:serine/threonine protein kinase
MDNTERLNMVCHTFKKPTVKPISSYSLTKEQVPFSVLKELFPPDVISPINSIGRANNAHVCRVTGSITTLIDYFCLTGVDVIRKPHVASHMSTIQGCCVKMQVYFQQDTGHLSRLLKEEHCHIRVASSLQMSTCCPVYLCGVSIPVTLLPSSSNNISKNQVMVRLTFMEYLSDTKVLSYYMDPMGEFAQGANPDDHVRMLDSIFRQVKTLLASLWSLGMVHCDMHEHNVLVDIKRGKVYIIDFGYTLTQCPGLTDMLALLNLNLPDVNLSVKLKKELLTPPNLFIDYVTQQQMSVGCTFCYLDSLFLLMFHSHLSLLKFKLNNLKKNQNRNTSKNEKDVPGILKE